MNNEADKPAGHHVEDQEGVTGLFQTVFFLLFYLVMLLYGGLSSTQYALEYGERSYSAWRPYMAPIKIVMTFGVGLMLLQAIVISDYAFAEHVRTVDFIKRYIFPADHGGRLPLY